MGCKCTGGTTPPVLALDLLSPSEVVVAYSVRQLRLNYAGPCLRIRDNVTNIEQDFGFLPDGTLDVPNITAFLVGNIGRVVTWYDQSANGYHASQTAPGDQPAIMLTGGVAGNASIQFILNPTFLRSALFNSSTIPHGIGVEAFNFFGVAQKNDTGLAFSALFSNGIKSPAFYLNNNAIADRAALQQAVIDTFAPALVLGKDYCLNFYRDTVTATLNHNGIASPTVVPFVQSASQAGVILGATTTSGVGGAPSRDFIAELIWCKGITVAQRAAMNANIIAFYGLTP